MTVGDVPGKVDLVIYCKAFNYAHCYEGAGIVAVLRSGDDNYVVYNTKIVPCDISETNDLYIGNGVCVYTLINRIPTQYDGVKN